MIIKFTNFSYDGQRKADPSAAFVVQEFIEIAVRVEGPSPELSELVDYVREAVRQCVEGHELLELQHQADCIATQCGGLRRSSEADGVRSNFGRNLIADCIHLADSFKGSIRALS